MSKNQKKNLLAAFGATVAGLAIVNPAFAALPTEATAAMTALEGDVDTVLSWIWGIAMVVLGSMVALKMVKRGGNKV